MNPSTLFWVIVVVAFLFSLFGAWRAKDPAYAPYAPFANFILLFVLVLILGWRVFGPLIR